MSDCCTPPVFCNPPNFAVLFPDLVGPTGATGPAGFGIAVLPSIAALRAYDVTSVNTGTIIVVLGYYAQNDGGGGEFVFDKTSVAADNGGTIIAPTVGSGRWNRSFNGTVTPQMFGAKADGVTDDQTAFQAAITFCVAGAHNLFVPGGDYAINSALSVTGALRISGVGYSSHLIVTSTDNGIGISGSNVSVEFLRLSGAASRMIAAIGSATSGLTIQRCDISGAIISPVILNSAGIYIDGYSDILIDSCYLHGNGTGGTPKGWDISVNNGVSSVSTNVVIRNNRIVSSTTSIGIALFMCSLSKVLGNEVSTVHQDGVTNSGYGILIYSKDTTRLVKNVVANNSVHDCLGSGIYFVGVDDSVITGNTSVNNATTQTDASLPVGGISINDGNYNSVTGNTVHTSGKDGIVVLGLYNSVTGNSITAAVQFGVHLRGATSYNVVSANVISSCAQGIYGDTAVSGVTVTGNSIKSTTSWGIQFANLSSGNISSNQMNIVGSGLIVLAGSQNNITGNTINGGGAGGAGVAIEVLASNCLIANNRGDSFAYGIDEEGGGNITRDNYFSNCTNERTDSAPLNITSGATPAVNTADVFTLSYAGATNITNFTGAVIGDTKTFRATNGNATIKNGATILLQGGVDFAMATNNVLVLRKMSATEWMEVSRKT